MSSTTEQPSLLCLDVGAKRIGVARAFLGNPFPQPCTTIRNDDRVMTRIATLVSEEQARAVVVGLPRSLEGHDTAQTGVIREFTERLKKAIDVPVFFQDEAGTSKQAQSEMANHKGRSTHSLDELAAVYILEDFVKEDAYHELLD